MGVLAVAVALTALIALAALGLGLLLARRYRELHQAVRDFQSSAGPQGVPERVPDPGTPVAPFMAQSTDGTAITESAFVGAETLVAFLLGGCSPCKESIPELIERAAEPGPRPVVVVSGKPGERAGYVASLAGAVTIVEEDLFGGATEAFGVNSFPTFLVVGDGVVKRAATRLSDLGVAVPA
jgi:hypothetical protein